MARPNPLIDWKKVDQSLIAGCTGTEIAAQIGIHPDTLYKRCREEKGMGFTAYLQQKRAHGDTLIKVAQFDEAVRKRDRGMLIWLGKNRLGQSDKEEVQHKGEMPIQVVSFNGKPLEKWTDDKKDS